MGINSIMNTDINWSYCGSNYSMSAMDAKFYLMLLTGVLLQLFSVQAGLKPNLGDVRLYGVVEGNQDKMFQGEAQIYLTDGNSPTNWSRICKTHSFNYEEAEVFCRQLGYSGGEISEQSSGSNYPMMISNFECGRSRHQHMLRCDYTIGNYICLDSVSIQCSNTSELTAVNGQLKLCPPDSNEISSTTSVTSTSFGIISINFDKVWKAIGNSSISAGVTNLANLMCYSMGFQKAVSGSVMTAKALDMYTFSTCRFADSSWINLTQLDCDVNQPYRCFGCCLQYPYHQACSKKPCAEDFIVIQCLFDPFDKETRSDPKNCTFQNNPLEGERIMNYGSTCTFPGSNNTGLNVAVGIETAFIFIMGIVFAIIIFNFFKKKTCIEYQPINEPVGRS